jgi:hypothetical protein
MTSEALTQLLSRQDGQATSNGLDHTPIPDPSEEVVQLRCALVSNRRISLAMGILMRDQDIDESQAFASLRHVSQDTNRKLRDVAEDVIRQRGLRPNTRRAERLHS